MKEIQKHELIKKNIIIKKESFHGYRYTEIPVIMDIIMLTPIISNMVYLFYLVIRETKYYIEDKK